MPAAQSVMLLAVVRRGREETAAFSQALRELDHLGLKTHCSDPATSHWWLSEEPKERRQAVKWCRSCPVLAGCGQAARARGERFGVWGAVDYTRNPKRELISS